MWYEQHFDDPIGAVKTFMPSLIKNCLEQLEDVTDKKQ